MKPPEGRARLAEVLSVECNHQEPVRLSSDRAAMHTNAYALHASALLARLILPAASAIGGLQLGTATAAIGTGSVHPSSLNPSFYMHMHFNPSSPKPSFYIHTT
jgi:hypothetical protein